MPDDVGVAAWARLFRVYKVLLEGAEADLKSAGLPSLSWYDVLLEVYRAPKTGIRQKELGEQVLLPKYNLSRLLDRLEAQGLVERYICAEDKRGSSVCITPSGRAMLKRMWKVYGESIDQRFAQRLTQEEMRELLKVLAKL